ncbi:MAG: TIGR04076 family protein [Chloroflexi bacterium]|nr:TIGR04076 family protein [Chloroflexota bacterium]
MREVIAKVISQKGNCVAAHKVGDEFIIGQTTPAGFCSWAFYTLFPFAQVLQFGGSLPWEADANKAIVACPDPASPVVFELMVRSKE